MNHCKKLVLMPHDSVTRLQEKTTDRTAKDVMTELDSAMNNIMKQRADDSEKWAQYQQTLQRYLHFAGEQRRPLELLAPLAAAADDDSTSRKQPSAVNRNEELRGQTINLVPLKSKQSAAQLFDLLVSDRSSPFISWDATGVVSINNAPVPGSNIVDLISDACRSKTKAEAPFVEKFVGVLKKINAPISLIGNAEYKRLMRKNDDPRSDSESPERDNYETPKSHLGPRRSNKGPSRGPRGRPRKLNQEGGSVVSARSDSRIKILSRNSRWVPWGTR